MSFPELSPTAAHGDLDRFRIIDVREAHEFHGPLGHVGGAELVPLSTLESRAAQLSDGRSLLLVCRSGKRSAMACEKLQKLGLRDVTNLAGGMIAWNRAALPVIRTGFDTLAALLDSLAAWLAQLSASTPAEARSRIDALLLEAGASLAEPTPAAVDQLLETLSSSLRETGAPPDLDLSVDAYRKDLAVI